MMFTMFVKCILTQKDTMYIVYIKVNIIELVVQLSCNIAMASTLLVNRQHINHPCYYTAYTYTDIYQDILYIIYIVII